MSNYRRNTSDYHGRQNCGYPPQMTPYTNKLIPEVCCEQDDPLDSLSLAMAYVPWQNWCQPYETNKALCQGTIFPQLNQPFCQMGGGFR
ncbi:MAG: spore coat associated protein CotJA [Lachnospiraceae bacterium]